MWKPVLWVVLSRHFTPTFFLQQVGAWRGPIKRKVFFELQPHQGLQTPRCAFDICGGPVIWGYGATAGGGLSPQQGPRPTPKPTPLGGAVGYAKSESAAGAVTRFGVQSQDWQAQLTSSLARALFFCTSAGVFLKNKGLHTAGPDGNKKQAVQWGWINQAMYFHSTPTTRSRENPVPPGQFFCQ